MAKIDPTNFGRRDHMVSEVQHKGIRKEYGSTPTTTVSARREIENKWKDGKRKLYTEKSYTTRKIETNKALGTKSPRVNGDNLQPVGALARRLNHENPYWTKTVTGSVIS